MSRRLGDDPLTRRKAAQPAAIESAAQVATTSSRPSNDVFFQRRESAPTQPAAPAPAETSEISEISELPAIKDAAAAPAPEVAEPVVQAEPTAAPVPAVAQVSIIEEAVAKLNASGGTRQVESNSPSTSDGTADASPQDDGLLKRLFGKLR